MEKGKYTIEPITEYFQGEKKFKLGLELLGAKFIHKDTGEPITVTINSNHPDYITISVAYRLEIMPWATNVIRVRHAKE